MLSYFYKQQSPNRDLLNILHCNLTGEEVSVMLQLQACTGTASGLAQTMVSLQKKLILLLVVIPAHNGGVRDFEGS